MRKYNSIALLSYSATGVTVYIHDFALRIELVMTVNRTRQCGQVLEAQDGNGVPIPTVVPTGAAPVRALQGCVLATRSYSAHDECLIS